jgi:hypothetical protein
MSHKQVLGAWLPRPSGDTLHHRALQFITHPQGRVAIQIASKPCRDCLEARFLFMSRFDVNLDKSQCACIFPPFVDYSLLTPFRYISATSRVVIASEKTTAAAGGETIVRKVALKFMKNKDQFAREKESRGFFKDLDNYVVGIHHAYTTDDKVYTDALGNSCVPIPAATHQSPTSHLVYSYFHDFKDYPFLLVMPSADRKSVV